MTRSKRLATTLTAILVLTLCIGARSQEVDTATEAALQLQNAFTSVAEKAFPAVVVITNKRIERSPMYQDLPPMWRYFFGLPESEPEPSPRGGRTPRPPRTPQPAGKGSGIILKHNGYILTNYHVIKDSDALQVQLQDGRDFDSARDADEVVVVGTDEETDLAVLRVGNGTVSGLPTLEFGDSDKVKAGEWAIAVGAPFNLDNSVTVGVVSQKGRHDVGMNTYENYIQTDASINPGNSGGPLLNVHGQVIGVNDFILTGGMSRGSIGLGFAVASNLAAQVAADLIEHGDVVRPFLGIDMQSLSPELKKHFNVEFGVLVKEVFKDFPADEAGVKPGDVVLKVGDKPVRTPHDLQFAVLDYKPGDTVKLLVARGGEQKVFEVVARRRDETDGHARGDIRGRDDLLNRLGLALEENGDGIVVSGVVAGSAADAANLRRSDLILEVNQQAVKNVRDVVEALAHTKDGIAVLYVDRRGRRFFVPVRIPAQE